MIDCLHNETISLKKIEKYSISTDSLQIVGDILDDHAFYCVCGFIDKLYFIGGYLQNKRTASCKYFDTNDYTWGNVASMEESRISAACTVFEERIVVAGGWDVNDVNSRSIWSDS